MSRGAEPAKDQNLPVANFNRNAHANCNEPIATSTMATYSSYSFATSSDALDALLLSSPLLTASEEQHHLHLPPLDEPLESQQPQPTRCRRSNSTMAMLMGPDQDELRCRYPSKLCRNARVRKASGALHRYCAHHRDKANANQKRWVDRQRNEGGVGSPTASKSSSMASPSSVTSFSLTKYRWIMAATAASNQRESSNDTKEEATSALAGAATLSDDDWNALLSLLAPPASSRPATQCEHRRRAISSPILPTFATGRAYSQR